MRIINKEDMICLDSILIMLTKDEAAELGSKLKSLNPDNGDHIHISDINFTKEITIAVYTDKNLHLFSENIRNIVAKQE